MSDFVSFARAHGLELDYAIPDGRWHRCKTSDKPRKKNGAYLFDGERGVVKNFATMQDYAPYRDGANAGSVDKSVLRARRVIAEAETRAKQDEARSLAEDMLKRAKLEVHPYLDKKGFPLERGLVLGGELLVPMREYTRYRVLNSVQRILADGTKLFLPGGKAKGSVFLMGPLVPHERWLCEGYATGLSVRAALRELHRVAQVICCFSADNLIHVAKLCRKPAFVMADHDFVNKQTGKRAGEEAAKASSLPWVMPPDEGTDANDMHQRYGVRALANLIRSLDAVRHKGVAA